MNKQRTVWNSERLCASPQWPQLVDTTCSQSPQSAALPAAKLRPKLPKSNKGCLVKASNSAPTTLDGAKQSV